MTFLMAIFPTICLLATIFQAVHCHQQQLLLPQFMVKSSASTSSSSRNPKESEPEPDRDKPITKPGRPHTLKPPCYFSPVQCLLRTPGQHKAFVEHQKFHHPIPKQHFRRRTTSATDEVPESRNTMRHHRRRHHPHHQHYLLVRMPEGRRLEEPEANNMPEGTKMAMAAGEPARATLQQRLFGNPWTIRI